jgi:hypothetical protein
MKHANLNMTTKSTDDHSPILTAAEAHAEAMPSTPSTMGIAKNLCDRASLVEKDIRADLRHRLETFPLPFLVTVIRDLNKLSPIRPGVDLVFEVLLDLLQKNMTEEQFIDLCHELENAPSGT